MKQHALPLVFDGAKFASRYGLNSLRGDFWISNGLLFYPDSLPDEPIFDLPDPPGPTAQQLLEARLVKIEKDISDIKDGTIKLPK